MSNYERFFFAFLSKKKHRFVLITLALMVSACTHTRKIVLANNKCILDFRNARTLSAHLKKNEFKFNKLSAKLNAEAFIDSSSNSFTVNLRIKQDSVIWLSLSKLGIEGARILATKDSVKLINRISGKYFIGDYSYLSKLLSTELDFDMLQSLLVGNSITFYDEDEKIKAGVDNCMYTLGTVRKYKMRRVINRGKELKEPAQSIYLIPETYKISKILFYEFNPDRSFEVTYDGFKKCDSVQLFPMNLSYKIRSRKYISIDANFTKLVFNEEQTYPFKIPTEYEQIVGDEKK